MPFTKEIMPWCPYPFKNETYGPETNKLLKTNAGKGQSSLFPLPLRIPANTTEHGTNTETILTPSL